MQNLLDVIIVGGSHAGLSAALILGRSLRKVLVVDNNKPRNLTAYESHSFYTRDGENPLTLLKIAKDQSIKYQNVSFINGFASDLSKTGEHFEVKVKDQKFSARRIILSTGVKDILPDIKGLEKLWGTHLFHCPYCHGWEVKDSKIALIDLNKNFEFINLILHWNPTLTLFTNGTSYSANEVELIKRKDIKVIDKKIDEVKITGDEECEIIFNGQREKFRGIFLKPGFIFNNELAVKAGCKTGESGEVLTDELHQTSVEGIYAARDLIRTHFHQVAVAAASGLQAGICVNTSLL
jgi:thioredoxin reductase